jgi:Xaa-Pro aminopeptidase
MGASMTEFELKLARIRNLLERYSLDALLLQRVENFAWVTCGAASYINLASSSGNASLLITPVGRYLLTDNIEQPRLEQEECLDDQGWGFRVAPWHEVNPAVAELTRGLNLGSDAFYPGAVDISAAFPPLRAQLTPEEGARFRKVAQLCSAAMDAAIRSIHPGMTEHQIAALLAAQVLDRGVSPIVNLIATDQRVFRYRHPLPMNKKLEAYAMLVLCGRLSGLVCSITRLVHFGRLADELRRKAEAVARIDAQFVAGTRPGRKLSEIMGEAVAGYEAAGFPDEWRLHHQGGPAGYLPREIVATPQSEDVVAVGQAYAWNPSITGTKSEDTILVGAHDNEILTTIPGWPVLSVGVNGRMIDRPAILEIR